MLRGIFKSGSLKSTITFAVGGMGFALANIILAAVLPPAQFGLLSLFLALLQFGLACGPLGLDVVVNRHRPRVTAALLRRALISATLVAVVIAVGAKFFYDLSWWAAILVFAGGALGACHFVIVGVFRSRAQLGWALTLENTPNYVLLLLSVVCVLFSVQSALPLMVGMVLGYVASNLAGWARAVRSQEGVTELNGAVVLREGLSAVSISLSRQLLWQLERFAIPKLTSVNDLATYAALAAVVAAPFRVTQLGVAFTLIEKLRSARTAAAGRAVLRHEVLVGTLIVVASVVGVIAFAPLVFHFVLRDKYTISPALMAATLAVGVARVAEGFSTTVVTALGNTEKLARISALGWFSLVVAIGGVIVGGRLGGLAGILCGTCLGWLTLCAGGCVIGGHSFRRRFAGMTAAPIGAVPGD